MRNIFIVFVMVLLSSCAMTTMEPKKINGVSFVASRDTITSQHISPMININANYAAIMPFGFIKDIAHPQIIHNTERQWYGETSNGARQYISALKEKGIKIMMKPQIWVWKGEFTGLIKMNTEEEWLQLENAYKEFIIEYAKVAQDTNTEILCIGTELENFVKYRPNYWKTLIDEIKVIYKGKLTYAANWNEYNKTPFWNQLDYIGIDAYFPVSDLKTPTIEDCKNGWKKHKEEIIKAKETYNKPVLFTEFGYRSVDFAGKQPWKADMDMDQVNLEAQLNATQAIFEEFWEEDWFAGGFIWKWFHKHEAVGGLQDTQFTPQNKPSEHVIKEKYKMY